MSAGNEMGLFLIVCNLVLFGMAFVLASFLAQKVVIDGIHTVNRSSICAGRHGEHNLLAGGAAPEPRRPAVPYIPTALPRR
jgi:Na+-transporting methylmalonyl-CoA/oxaloacetate decarboxylase gamma subunit